MKLSIVIPVYAGEQTVEALHAAITSYVEIASIASELIYVYDCGTDNSWEVLLSIKESYPDTVKLVQLSRNYGQHNALIAGFEVATGDYIVTMDEDLQHLPQDIDRMLLKQKEKDYDVVYGIYTEAQHSRGRNITSFMLKKLLSTAIPELHKDYSAFRLLKTSIAKQTLEMRNSYTFLDGYLSWVTSHIASTEVSHQERIAGKSSYTFKKLVAHSVNIFVTFSNLPIRLLTYSSIFIFLATIVYSIYVIVRTLIFNDFLKGYPTLIITIGFGVGMILLGMGIIGEYIYRINLKTTKRPHYLIKKII